MTPATDQGRPAPVPEGWTEPPAGSARPLDLRALWNVLWRRKALLAVSVLLALGAGAVYLKRQVPLYTASAEIMLTGREETVVNLHEVVENLNGHDRNLASNELRIIASQRLIGQVIDRLRLDRDPEFNATLAPSGRLDAGTEDLETALRAGLLGTLLDPLLGPETQEIVDEASRTRRERLAVERAFRDRLAVWGIPRTQSIGIAFTSDDPVKAALIANTLADLYIVDQLETKFEATQRASAWLSRRIDGLKQKVRNAEAAVEAFKARQSIGPGQGSDVTRQQIAELNARLIAARAARAEAEARFAQVETRARTGGAAAAADVVSSALILTLRTNLSELRRRAAELGQTYGAKHPNMINIRAEIRDAESAIAAEVQKTIEGLRNDVAVARARERTLADGVAELEDRSVTLSRASVELRQLEREAEADRLIYETFLNRFRETSEQEDLQTADARLLARATPPLTPSAPNRRKLLAFAGAGGTGLGLGLVLLMELLANTFRAASEVADRTGRPVLSTLPRFGHRRGRKRRRAVLDYVREKPNSALAEAVRRLRTALFLSDIDTPPRVVMVTSSVPGEGKSTTALLLAHMSLQMNKTAIVVDCDIRRPTLSETFGIESKGGLLSVLEGGIALEEAVTVDAESGLHVLPTAEAIPQAADVLSSARFRQLIAALRERYDLVILDTPPVLPVSDAAAIGKLADTAIYAVRWNHTPRETAAQGLAALDALGVRIAGCVVTLVDQRAEAGYAYARYGQGHGRHAGADAYYAN